MADFRNIVRWTFGAIFFALGVLNSILVHPVPGIFYLLLSVIYLPPVNASIKRRFGFSIPFAAHVIVGLVILWGTLAVGDLAEMAGL